MTCLATILLTIRILCIGNSFSWDAVEQELVPLCDAKGIEVEVHNLYYGGCSLQQHAEFMFKDTAAYSYRVCSNNKSPIPHRQSREIRGFVSLREALKECKYDFISFQQASHVTTHVESLEGRLLILIIMAQQAKFCTCHQYWRAFYGIRIGQWDEYS